MADLAYSLKPSGSVQEPHFFLSGTNPEPLRGSCNQKLLTFIQSCTEYLVIDIYDRPAKMGLSSSDTEKPHTALRKHNRSSSSDQPSKSQIYISSNHNTFTKYPMEAPPTPTSPRSPSKSKSSHRPDTKRQTTTTTTKHKSTRPGYSRKYSTPPSRPLSPSGFPQLLENDMCIPEIDLNHVGMALRNQTQTAPPVAYRAEPRPLNVIHYAPAPAPIPSINYISQSQSQSMGVEVDTAPQEPDIWSDPETDYFSSIEGPASRKAYHARGQSRRQLSQSVNALGSLNAVMAVGNGAKGLHQIHEDSEAEFLDLQIPGGFA